MYDPNGDEKVSYMEFAAQADAAGVASGTLLPAGGSARPQARAYGRAAGSAVPDVRAHADVAGALRVLQGSLLQKNISLGDMFLKVDRDRSGFISARELREMLDDLPVLVDDAVLQQVLQVFDENGDGQVAYNEFVSTF